MNDSNEIFYKNKNIFITNVMRNVTVVWFLPCK